MSENGQIEQHYYVFDSPFEINQFYECWTLDEVAKRLSELYDQGLFHAYAIAVYT